ncbi:MAG: class I SAM-dependent methyltransferase [Planctomycetota bacterium]|nr:class I SAM-dependent methyltransferase [Planctomycetota bacterium]
MSELVFGWGNTSFSAQTEYLERCMVEVAKSTGPILECGSGLSTLVLGTVAQRNNLKMWSFENSPEWALRVRTQLEKYGITSVKVCDTPLRSYGEYNWYDSSGESLPNDFGLVICDGPPAQTPGGRYGMYPQVKGRLRPDCKIMVDDADREQEREICARWKQENGGRFEIFGETKRFIVFDCGSQG